MVYEPIYLSLNLFFVYGMKPHSLNFGSEETMAAARIQRQHHCQQRHALLHGKLRGLGPAEVHGR